MTALKNYKNIEGNYYEKAHGAGAHKSQSFMYKSREDYFVEFMSLKGNEKILDIGCGSGTFTKMLAKKYPRAKITGMDTSEAVVNFAKKSAKKEKIANIKFEVGEANKIPLKQNFDVIILSHLIEHLENPLGALAQAKKHLRKGGLLFITTPNYASLWPLAEMVFDKTIAKNGYSLDEQHISRFTNSSIKKLVGKAGFEVQKTRTLYILSLEASVLSQALGWALYKVDKALDFVPLGMITYLKASKK